MTKSPSNIPEAAVEAALNARREFKSQRCMDNATNLMRHILEAALPHTLEAAAFSLEDRMDDATDAFEEQYIAGYADAIARLLHIAKATK